MIKQKIEGQYTTKYLFFNGSEISFKRENSAEYKKDLNHPEYIDKHKYSLVLSCSVGCNIGCKFCHLTQNKKETKTLHYQEILMNIKEVIQDQCTLYPDLKNKAIKLCWMGEGEPLLHTKLIRNVTTELIPWVLTNNYAKYLDGVDIATSYPKVSKNKWTADLKELTSDLSNFDRNPYQDSRSVLRLFYSLHNSIQQGRNTLIPVSKPIEKALPEIKTFCDTTGVDMIVHYMFIDKINDSGGTPLITD